MNLNANKILTRSEFQQVLDRLKPLARRSKNTHQNLIIFRLSACCGLRVAEIVALNISDIRIGREKPFIFIRCGKGGKKRVVPLNWDADTLYDISEWKRIRETQGATAFDPFLCCQAKSTFGRRMSDSNAQHRWRTAIGCLGAERTRELSIHCGRHTFCSHALHSGKNVIQVREAAGHSNVATTNICLHLMDDDGAVGHILDYSEFSKPKLKVIG